jgi:hypothetical protein
VQRGGDDAVDGPVEVAQPDPGGAGLPFGLGADVVGLPGGALFGDGGEYPVGGRLHPSAGWGGSRAPVTSAVGAGAQRPADVAAQPGLAA